MMGQAQDNVLLPASVQYYWKANFCFNNGIVALWIYFFQFLLKKFPGFSVLMIVVSKADLLNSPMDPFEIIFIRYNAKYPFFVHDGSPK